MNTLILVFSLWTILGFVCGVIILVITSIFITEMNNGDDTDKAGGLYKTTVLLGGPGTWLFAYWVKKQFLTE